MKNVRKSLLFVQNHATVSANMTWYSFHRWNTVVRHFCASHDSESKYVEWSGSAIKLSCFNWFRFNVNLVLANVWVCGSTNTNQSEWCVWNNETMLWPLAARWSARAIFAMSTPWQSAVQRCSCCVLTEIERTIGRKRQTRENSRHSSCSTLITFSAMQTHSLLITFLICLYCGVATVECTISPSDKGKKAKAQKELKVNSGPVDQNVIERNLIEDEPAAKDILIESAAYYRNTSASLFDGPVLVYVTPVSHSMQHESVNKKRQLNHFSVEQSRIRRGQNLRAEIRFGVTGVAASASSRATHVRIGRCARYRRQLDARRTCGRPGKSKM